MLLYAPNLDLAQTCAIQDIGDGRVAAETDTGMAMKRRLILHIGYGKTGSSAIQAFIKNNCNPLLSNGVLVPDDKLDINGPFTGEQIFFFQNISASENRAEVLERRFARLASQAAKYQAHTIVVSAESLAALDMLVPALEATTRQFDRKIVFYIRRQDDWLLSAWQQWWLKVYDSLPAFLDEAANRLANWNRIIRPWELTFGAQAVSVRLFHRDTLVNGDVVEDFLATTGIPSEGCAPLRNRANSSFDEHVGDLVHRVRDLFDGPHDNEVYWRMIRLLGSAVFKSRKGSHLLTLPERLALMARFERDNTDLRNRHFPELGDAPLFNPPTEADVVTLSSDQRLVAENAVLTRAVLGLAGKLEQLEERLKALEATPTLETGSQVAKAKPATRVGDGSSFKATDTTQPANATPPLRIVAK